MSQHAGINDSQLEQGQPVVRQAAQRDVPQMMEIERSSFPTPWSPPAMRREIDRKGAVYLVAILAGKIVGYCGMWVHGNEAHVTNIAIHPRYRRCGVATRLMVELLQRARRAGSDRAVLEYRANNRPAAEFYASIGFQINRIRQGYYHDTGEDAVEAILTGLQTPRVRDHLQQLRQTLQERDGPDDDQ